VTDDLNQKTERARQTLERLLTEYKTISLATRDKGGKPQVSYAPVAVDNERCFYLFVSELSEHTANLQDNGLASIMVVEDENRSDQLFARSRLTLEGKTQEVSRGSERWTLAADVYRRRFGKFFDTLAQLRDFHMFCFQAKKARVVVGFGAAFEVKLPDWTQLELLTGK
jgi:putative heme iron utilization protein